MRSLVVLSRVVVALMLCSAVQARNHVQPPQASGTCCTDIKKKTPDARSGIYVIQPVWAHFPFRVHCEMRADGGWTVFQRRSGQPVSFQKSWAQYTNGFGELTDDHWLGLQKVHLVTEGPVNSVLRVELVDHEGGNAYAEYKNFRVGNECMNFRLQVGQYSGSAGDAIRSFRRELDQNGFSFSTMDRDNDGCAYCIFGDIAVSQCSELEGSSGWWFSRCGFANLNGDYHPTGNHIGWMSGLHWNTWKVGMPYSVKESRMMIKNEE